MVITKKTGVSSVCEDEEEGVPLCTVHGNVSWCSHYENNGKVPPKLKIGLPCDPLLGKYSKEMKTEPQRHLCPRMLTTALFTTAKTGEQPRCLSTDEWIKLCSDRWIGRYRHGYR